MKTPRPLLAAAVSLATLALLAACSNAPNITESAYDRGLAALAKDDPRTARIELLNAIKAAPNDPKVRLAQAEALLALRDGAGAQAELERARKIGATVADTAHLMAQALLLQGAYEAAAREAMLAGPSHAGHAAWVRGLALAAAGDRAAAAAALQQAVAAAPRDPRAWIAHARLRREEGDVQGALASVGKAIALKPAFAEALILKGELIRRQYGLGASLPWFDRALEIDPNNEVALLERAASYGEIGRMTDMLADTRKVLSLSAQSPRAFYLQAMLAARAGNFELAKSLFQRTRGKLDGQPATMLLASAIDYQTGAVQQAAKRLTRLVELQPDNRKARRLLAASYWRLGDAAATAAALRPIADQEDADRYSLTLMGRALAATGQPDKGAVYLARAAQPQQGSAAGLLSEPASPERLQELRYAASINPGSPEAQVRLIRALLSTGLGDEALQRAQTLQAGNPGVPEAHLLVGDALGMRGDFRGAAEQYRRAANLSFTEPVALRLIEALERSGQGAAAARVLDLFLQQNPRSVPAHMLAATAYMRARDWPAAIEVYEGLRRRLGDRDAVMLNNLAWAYSEEGEIEQAIPLARKAWALDPSNPATADTLGWLLVKSGKKAEGLVLLERAARGAPTDAEIARRLAAARRG